MDKKNHQEIRDDKVKAAAPAEEQTSGNAAAAASPPSASSSPSHEFSFTISLHQPSAKAPDRTKSPPAPTEEKPKSRSFSLFWLPKWRKGYEVRDKEEEKEKHGRKLKFDITQVVKRYMRMVRPLLSFRQSRRGNLQFDRQAYSYSGHLNLRGKKDIRGKRGEYSAPASMRTSPTNSGLLVPPATSPTSSSDSTMEELQAAIQAAIAHCKNSIQVEDKLKCQD
nr:BRI1 kinase inhibitor 1-like [Ipomoea batatas]GMD93668.1 BRI1 kinase inhibitor 1-like [Ipomoea batatas]